MHLKVSIADDSTVTTGSYNYTDETTYDNDEVLVIIHSPSIANDWDSEFGRMWADTASFFTLHVFFHRLYRAMSHKNHIKIT